MRDNIESSEWYEDDSSNEAIDYPIYEYDIIASPNDFNVATLYNFVENGTILIPGFQRNYVWDIKRASKLIESLIIGLPIPQIFLYEEGRNRFSIIDGQQRLMSIFYFKIMRFPRTEKRSELRLIFDQENKLPKEIIDDDEYFTKFNLSLPVQIPKQRNKFSGLNYSTLGEYQSIFDLRPIRTFIVRQTSPKDDDSSMFELFNRLNTGGVNLRPQEIRTSLYHSQFYVMLYKVNTDERWRRFLNFRYPDLNQKDVEFILRGFANLIKGDEYSSAMIKFLNDFSRFARGYQEEAITYFEKLFYSFLDSCSELDDTAFLSSTGRFSVIIYEAVFVAVCRDALISHTLIKGKIVPNSVEQLKADLPFLQASEKASGSKDNVNMRIQRAEAIIEVIEVE